MELQLQRYGEWSHDALHVVFKPPWRTNGERRAHRIRPRAHKADESLRLSLIDTEPGNGIHSKVSPAERWKGLPRNFVAAPRYSSLLKLTRRRRHEVRMETRERVYLSISDWVFRRVKDPLVEVDPVTLSQAIIAEEESEGWVPAEEPTVATSTSPSLFGYLPPGFPKGTDKAAIAVGILLVLATLGTAVILALLRGKKQGAGSVTHTHLAPEGPEANGSVTNGGARQEVEDDRKVTWQESSVDNQGVRKQQPVPFVTSSIETQATPYLSIPQYSTAMDQSDLPLPPSFGGGTKDRQIDPPSSSSADDHRVDPFVTRPDDDEQSVAAGHEANEAIGEEIVGSNGVGKGDRPLEEVTAEVSSAVVALQEELTTETKTGSEEEGLELGSVEDSPSAADEPVTGGAEGLPSASESLEEGLLEVFDWVEYILIGDSDSLSAVGDFVAPPRPKRAHPARADVGVPVYSILVDESSAQPPREKTDVLSASARGAAVLGGSNRPFEDLQAGSGADVADERRKESTQIIEKVLPAVSVGAGVAALSAFSGVEGALQVVGALATASILREVFWAGPRQQLFDELRNIKSHKQLVEFLEEKNIFPPLWSH